MQITVKQVSSLQKILPSKSVSCSEFRQKTAMKGEVFSYQISLDTTETFEFNISVNSDIKDCIKIYSVKNIPADFPTYTFADDEYITKEPTLIPDMLMPLELENNRLKIANESASIWVYVSIPENIDAGFHPIDIVLSLTEGFQKSLGECIDITKTLLLDVTDKIVSKHKTMFAQWFHVDCIADIHNVEIYSEEHWSLIDKYMSLAVSLGMNMILTPVITPPLDTEVGGTRPCTQLVKIKRNENGYSFDFSLLDRWIDLCQKNGFEYYEISHLFSQWGLIYTPNIKVYENRKDFYMYGQEYYMFGWKVDARSPEYKEFLEQFLPALISFFKEKGIKDKCWFHISDEPHLEHLDAYKYAHDLVKPLIDGCITFDALSDYDFYEKGLVDRPVTATNFLKPFIENNVQNQWAYYCCGQYSGVGNRFLAQESFKNRILGLQLYKYNIQGFLQWGYNFYYNQQSRQLINPYVTTSADKAFPSGDPFSVYPIKNGVTPSLRALVFREALNDIQVCQTLEGLIGREKVIELIDNTAGMNLTFTDYPKNNYFITSLIEIMEKKIKEFC